MNIVGLDQTTIEDGDIQVAITGTKRELDVFEAILGLTALDIEWLADFPIMECDDPEQSLRVTIAAFTLPERKLRSV